MDKNEPIGHFNEVTYDSFPFADTQPANLAPLATFFGLQPPNVDDARVLELGCASGGNLIPLAARFPDATFEGLDISTKHVEMAQERIAALGLNNITIKQADLADDGLVEGEFDYIICHGVYSWIPREAQNGIFKLCADHLADNGIAYVSYNVLPGWQLRQIIRDVFQFDDDPSRTGKQRVERGHWLLQQLAKASNQETPYGQILRREATQLASQNESYVLSEFLVEENTPCYFHEFYDRATEAGLAYLCETKLASSLPQYVDPAMDQLIRAMSGPDVRMFEQYVDFLQGRQFRQSLLVKASLGSNINRTPDKARIAKQNFSSKMRIDQTEPAKKDGGRKLAEPNGPSVTTNDPAVLQAVDYLGEIYPETRTLTQILDHLKPKDAAERQAYAERILEAFTRLTITGMCRLSAIPVSVGKADAKAPKLWSLARHDADQGSGQTTGQTHLPVRYDQIMKAMIPFLDGKHDRKKLVAKLKQLLSDGTLQSSTYENVEIPDAKIEEMIEQFLLNAQKLGLLEVE